MKTWGFERTVQLAAAPPPNDHLLPNKPFGDGATARDGISRAIAFNLVDSSVEPPQLDVLNSESDSVSTYRSTTSSSAHVKRTPARLCSLQATPLVRKYSNQAAHLAHRKSLLSDVQYCMESLATVRT
ncbi:hypothetical protein H0E87_025021 [Populus deltoides]|uniref:Uncharacterized protein n=1 Tax=Populus deltoides TaxID=3696 RepID=A0A8T2XA39_POPDE|nr:hypothetical protein H0E87_025021 [Populus deltoides]